MSWQVQEAKQKFSAVLQRAINEGPQAVTYRGKKVAYIISAREYERLTEDKPDLATFLLEGEGPDLSLLDLERAKDLPRMVEW